MSDTRNKGKEEGESSRDRATFQHFILPLIPLLRWVPSPNKQKKTPWSQHATGADLRAPRLPPHTSTWTYYHKPVLSTGLHNTHVSFQGTKKYFISLRSAHRPYTSPDHLTHWYSAVIGLRLVIRTPDYFKPRLSGNRTYEHYYRRLFLQKKKTTQLIWFLLSISAAYSCSLKWSKPTALYRDNVSSNYFSTLCRLE